MRLGRWLRERKKKRMARRRDKLAPERSIEVEELQPLTENDPGIAPAESRFTEEYQDFLRQQIEAEAGSRNDAEEN